MHISILIFPLLTLGDTQTDMPNPTEFSETLNQTCTCREGFYCKNGSNLQCFPECGSWKQYSNTESNIIDAAVIVAVVIGIVSAIAVLTIAGVRRKKVYAIKILICHYICMYICMYLWGCIHVSVKK